MAKKEIIKDKRFYSDGKDFVVLKKVIDGKVVEDNTKKSSKKGK